MHRIVKINGAPLHAFNGRLNPSLCLSPYVYPWKIVCQSLVTYLRRLCNVIILAFCVITVSHIRTDYLSFPQRRLFPRSRARARNRELLKRRCGLSMKSLCISTRMKMLIDPLCNNPYRIDLTIKRNISSEILIIFPSSFSPSFRLFIRL